MGACPNPWCTHLASGHTEHGCQAEGCPCKLAPVDLAAKGVEPGPVLVETMEDAFGKYQERWMVEPPPSGAPYAVTREEWNEDYSVRTIWRWESA